MFPQVSVIAEIQLSGVCHFKNTAPKFLDIPLLRSEGQFPLPESGQVCKSFSQKNSSPGPLERLTLGEAGVTRQTPGRRPCPDALVHSPSWAPNWHPASSVNHTTEHGGPATPVQLQLTQPHASTDYKCLTDSKPELPSRALPESSSTKSWAKFKDHFKSLNFGRSDYPARVPGMWSLSSLVISVQKVRRQLCWDSGHKWPM